MDSGFLFVVNIVALLVVVALADGTTHGLLYNVTTVCGKSKSDDTRIHLTSLMPFDVKAYCRGGVITPFITSDNFNYYLNVSYPDGGSRPCVFEQLKEAELYIVEIVPSVGDSHEPVEFTVIPCPFFKNGTKDTTDLYVDDEAEYDEYKTVNLLNLKQKKRRHTSRETTEHDHPSAEESRSYKQKALTLLTKEEQLLREQQEHGSEANYPSTTTETAHSVTDQHNVVSHTIDKSLEDDSLMSPANSDIGVSVSKSKGVVVDSPKELSHLIIDPSNINQDKLLSSNTDSGEVDAGDLITIGDGEVNNVDEDNLNDLQSSEIAIKEGDKDGRPKDEGAVDVQAEKDPNNEVKGDEVDDEVNIDEVKSDFNGDAVNGDAVNAEDVNTDASFNGVDSPKTGLVEIDDSAEDTPVNNGPDIFNSSDVLIGQEENDDTANKAEETDHSIGHVLPLDPENMNDRDSTFVNNDKEKLPEQGSPANDVPLNQGQDGDAGQLDTGLLGTQNDVDFEEGRGSGLPSDSSMDDGSEELVESSINQGVVKNDSSDSSGSDDEDNTSTMKEEGNGSVSGGLSVVTLEVVNILGTKMETNELELGHKIRLRAVSDGKGHEAGIRPVSCYAMGSLANYAILGHGCGDGVVISRTKGFNTTGQQSTSPLFPVFKVGDDKVLSFHCNYTYCQDTCDGSSCNNPESEIKGTMTTLPDLEQGNGPIRQRQRKTRRQ